MTSPAKIAACLAATVPGLACSQVAASNGDPEETWVQPGKNLQEHRL